MFGISRTSVTPFPGSLPCSHLIGGPSEHTAAFSLLWFLEFPSFPDRAESRRQRSSRKPRLPTTASDTFATRVYPPLTVFASRLVSLHAIVGLEFWVTTMGFLVEPRLPYLSQLNVGFLNVSTTKAHVKDLIALMH